MRVGDLRFFLIPFFLYCAFFPLNCVDTAPTGFNVRVLMESCVPKNKKSKKFEWVLESESGFILSDLDDQSIEESIKNKKVELSLVKGRLALNGKRLSGRGVRIKPKKGFTGSKDNRYAGEFIFLKFKEKICLINELELEEYLFSVLRWESWPGWPPEVNKAMAVACRTYLVYNLLNVRKADGALKRPYDIRATNIDQTYKGIHGFKSLRKDLKDTKGIVMVMAHNNKIFPAMYDSCCGGRVPRDMSGFDFEKWPVLARGHACTFCKPKKSRRKNPTRKLYSWKLTYRLSDFEDIIRGNIENAVPVRDVWISKKDKAGMVSEVTVKTNSATFTFSGKKIYSLFKDLKSLCFSIEKRGKNLSFIGYGFGHCVGFCQWGAYFMVTEEGCGYKDVLYFYYPQIKFTKIEFV